MSIHRIANSFFNRKLWPKFSSPKSLMYNLYDKNRVSNNLPLSKVTNNLKTNYSNYSKPLMISFTIIFEEKSVNMSLPSLSYTSVKDLKCYVSALLSLHITSFYLTTRTKILLDHLPLSLFLPSSTFFVMCRLRGGSEDESTTVSNINVLAQRPFFLDKNNLPDTWLMLTDLSFANRKLTPTAKTNHVLNVLPTELLQSLGDKIINIMRSTDTDSYVEICTLVKSFYLPSETHLFDSYFRTQTLGSLSPSQFLSKARSDLERIHSGSSSNDLIIKRFFLSVLPDTVRAILAGSDKTSLDDLASIADKIITNIPRPNISNIETSLHDAIKTLTDQVTSLQLQVSSYRRSRSPNLSRSNSVNRDRSKSVSSIRCREHFKNSENVTKCYIGCSLFKDSLYELVPICVYHNVYRNAARRCLDGCTFHQKN